jgi:hypothetical protein
VKVYDTRDEKIFSTDHVDDCLDPVFEKASSTVVLPVSTAMPGAIRLEVWDHNVARNDFMGCINLAVKDLFAYGPGQHTRRLGPRDIDDEDEEILENAHALGSITYEIRGVPKVTNPPPPPKNAAPAPPVPVTVTVVKCDRLFDIEGKGKTDPKVKVVDAQGEKLLVTPASDNNLNPEFNAAKSSVKPKLSTAMPGCITFTVLNDCNFSDDFLGCVKVPIKDIFAYGPGTRTFRLSPRDDEDDERILNTESSLGTVTVKISGVPPVKTVPPFASYEMDPNLKPTQAVVHHAKTISFIIKSCKKLLNRDGSDDDSDPYVKAFDTRGEEVLVTKVMKNDINPDFDPATSKFQLNISAGTRGDVRFEVWDDDFGFDEFLGEAKYNVAELFKGKDGDIEKKLLPRKKESDDAVHKQAHMLGTITINVTGLASTEKATVVKSEFTKEEISAARQAASTKAKIIVSHVSMRVVKCRNLFNRAEGNIIFSGVSDPYVKVIDPYGKEIKKTEVVDNKLDPVFNEQAKVIMDCSVETKGMMTFNVLGHNKIGDDFMGQVTVNVKEIFAHGNGTRHFKLAPRANNEDDIIVQNGAALGSITIEFGGLPKVPKPKDMAKNELTEEQAANKTRGAAANKPVSVSFNVVGCKNLIDRDNDGSDVSDPYVKAIDTLGKQCMKTDKVKDNQNPTWPRGKASVTMDMVPGVPTPVTFQVWDDDWVSDEQLGSVKLSMDHVLKLGAGTHDLPLQVPDKCHDELLLANAHQLGMITLEIAGVPKSAVVKSRGAPGAPGSQDAPVAAAPPQQFTVGFYVAGCNKLIDRDEGKFMQSGKSDPYVEVFRVVNGKKKKLLTTPTIDDTLDPEWEKRDSEISEKLSSAVPGFMLFEVWDKDKMSDDFLGCAKLTMKDIFSEGAGIRTMVLMPRDKENDDEILERANALGTITVFVSGLPDKAELQAQKAALLKQQAPPAGAPSALGAPGAHSTRAIDADGAAPMPYSPGGTVPYAGGGSVPAYSGAQQQLPVDPANAHQQVAQQQQQQMPGNGSRGIAAAPPAAPAAPPQVVKSGEVTFVVTGGNDLMDRDGGGSHGVSDPYIKCLRGGKEVMKTKHVKDNVKDPKWTKEMNNQVQFSFVAGDTSDLVLQVWDDNWGSDDFLGEMHVTMDEFQKMGAAPPAQPASKTVTKKLCARATGEDKEVKARNGKLGTVTFEAFVELTMEDA